MIIKVELNSSLWIITYTLTYKIDDNCDRGSRILSYYILLEISLVLTQNVL